MLFITIDKNQYERLKISNEELNKADDMHQFKLVLAWFLLIIAVISSWISLTEINLAFSVFSSCLLFYLCIQGMYFFGCIKISEVKFPVPIDRVQLLLYSVKRYFLKVMIFWLISTLGKFGFDLIDKNLNLINDLIPTFWLLAVILSVGIYYFVLCVKKK